MWSFPRSGISLLDGVTVGSRTLDQNDRGFDFQSCIFFIYSRIFSAPRRLLIMSTGAACQGVDTRQSRRHTNWDVECVQKGWGIGQMVPSPANYESGEAFSAESGAEPRQQKHFGEFFFSSRECRDTFDSSHFHHFSVRKKCWNCSRGAKSYRWKILFWLCRCLCAWVGAYAAELCLLKAYEQLQNCYFTWSQIVEKNHSLKKRKRNRIINSIARYLLALTSWSLSCCKLTDSVPPPGSLP